jgi:hypothetical protein
LKSENEEQAEVIGSVPDSTAFYNKRKVIARYTSLTVGVAVFLSKRKSQHFAYGKILA